jgi:hypothetical protein
LHNLKKLNDPKLWACFQVGFAADDGITIIDASEVYFGKRKIRSRLNITADGWRSLTLAYLKASVDAHNGGPWPQYGLPDRAIVTYPEAIELIEAKNTLGNQIIERNRAHILRLIDDISREIGESIEIDGSTECEGGHPKFNA